MAEETGRRHVLVTGAARGLGRAIAAAFARRGDVVTVADVDAQAGKTSAVQIGHGCRWTEMDVSSRDSVAAAFAAMDGLPPVTVLVNNAGICSTEPFDELSLEQWNRIMAVNATGAFLCSTAVLPGMIAAGGGKIVNIGSFAGRSGGLMVSAAYSSSKAAVAGLTKAAAKQLAQYGIQVNCVAPSTLQTDMTAGWDDAELEKVRSSIPAGRLGTVEDVTGLVVFLCSSEADYITGTTVDVTGGLYVAP